jgi:hypothetical protein
MSAADATSRPAKQLLHLVFGGELKSLESVEFANVEALEVIGIFPTCGSPQSLEGGRPTQRRQCAHALFHRPHASAAGSRNRQAEATGLTLRQSSGAAIVHAYKGLHPGSLAAGNLIGRRLAGHWRREQGRAQDGGSPWAID